MLIESCCGILESVSEVGTGTKATKVNKTTEASDDVLESIENLTVAAMPEPVSYDPNDHIGKCSVRSCSESSLWLSIDKMTSMPELKSTFEFRSPNSVCSL